MLSLICLIFNIYLLAVSFKNVNIQQWSRWWSLINNAVLKCMQIKRVLEIYTCNYIVIHVFNQNVYQFISDSHFVADFDSKFESNYNAVRTTTISIATIIGIVVGLIFLVIVISIFVVCCCCMKSKWSVDFEFDIFTCTRF